MAQTLATNLLFEAFPLSTAFACKVLHLQLVVSELEHKSLVGSADPPRPPPTSFVSLLGYIKSSVTSSREPGLYTLVQEGLRFRVCTVQFVYTHTHEQRGFCLAVMVG